MEALAGLSLACNILQLAEVSMKVWTAGVQLWNAGSTQEHDELDVICQEIKHYLSRIQLPRTPSNLSPSQVQKTELIRTLCRQCDEVARELLGKLEQLKPKLKDGKLSRSDTIYKALLGVWSQSEMDSLHRRLQAIIVNIERHLAADSRDRLFERLDQMEFENRRLEAHRTDEMSQLKKVFGDLFADLGQRLQKDQFRSETVIALLQATTEGSHLSMEQIILEQLRFDTMEDRHEGIHEAHVHTLKWVFDAPGQHSAASFNDWLTSKDGIYWISGKPGSGKSTLMKYLASHPRTSEAMKGWAGGNKLVRADFFFWNSGKDSLQKSQEGLLRSILYQILRQCPDLIRVAYPNIWGTHGTTGYVSDISKSSTVSLSEIGLRDTLQKVSKEATESQTKFCFFVDGLDEYHGKPANAIELVEDLRSLFNAKMCLSSRPWNPFEEKFGKLDTAKLYMQDFNTTDITAYINHTFEKDENFQDLEDKDTVGAELIKEMADASNGVFLWVFLVVRSFQDGLVNGDRISDLRRRLEELPKDLNDYFRSILESDVDDFYHSQSALMFFVTLEAAEELPLMAYWFMLVEDPEYAVSLERKALSMQQVSKRMRQMRKGLNASCKGLLEVQDQRFRNERDALPSSIYFNRKINFLHRTVRDYLNLDQTRQMLRQWVSRDFDADEIICKAMVAQIKAAPEGDEYQVMNDRLFKIFELHRNRAKNSERVFETERGPISDVTVGEGKASQSKIRQLTSYEGRKSQKVLRKLGHLFSSSRT
ncbi:hypothetical protein GGR57DRAFT_494749 [Xylariaceae sp. FL1272]|nr:hypothetical protein GGR57DRAFT_494749 [Xylariaceae sp. FL1272]